MGYNFRCVNYKKIIIFFYNLFIFCSFFARVQDNSPLKIEGALLVTPELFMECKAKKKWPNICYVSLVQITAEQRTKVALDKSKKISKETGQPEGKIEGEKKNYPVKVLLCEEKRSSQNFSWQIESSDGFLLSDITKDTKLFYFTANKLIVTIKSGFIYVNNKRYLRKNLKIYPKSGYLSFGGNAYQGNFLITFDKDNIYLINKLDLEDYVFAVLRSESWPGWPIEVNKVFSIAIRTYVVYRVRQAKKCNRLYHVKNDNSHQTYYGHEFKKRNSDALRKAVEQTKGILLAYNSEIIDPMYDSCCGSIIPSHIENKVDFEKAPYLCRDYPCKYCQKCSLYNWKVCYTLKQLEKILSSQCPHIKNIRSLWVSKKDKAGLVKEITIRCTGHTYKISGDKLYTFLKKVKSFCFNIKRSGKTITMNGHGYGHHIGLCQWGARQMVRELFDYKQILAFYYPGTSFVRLS